MSGIDSPEKKQFYGQESNNFLAGLIYRRQVTVEMEGRDKYKRYLGKVYLKEKDINLEMIKSGFAWHYKKYSTNSGYSDSEKLAQENKLGLWNYENPIAPWNYRKKKFMRRVNL
ncbi:thermonuclease family protein [Leptospira stimsonii]|uniref:7-cyano-7-deazaguanine reductase n=1 Tax=Leptospira stimsonii TaxID=2202203 RepID=A0ABY2N356_9LEPT|nr:thermonuclease family protein [Leptospira stimsonii]TGK26079.1 7-cyano-7-deazaguanine reductase [Leptospira stimsonii]TGM14907.1 7-cyano-7-deazaguanine reductase [Leptospira stimsonii]